MSARPGLRANTPSEGPVTAGTAATSTVRGRGDGRRRRAGPRRLTHALDEHIVAPARLQLLTTLTAASQAEFATVRDALQVSDSVLSKHVSALESVGYVKRRKGVHRGRRTTWLSLTSTGRDRLSAHVAALRAVIDGIAL